MRRFFLVLFFGVLLLVAQPLFSGGPASLVDLVEEVGRSRLLEGNSVLLLDDGPRDFEQRLALIASARHHLLISTFIWRMDEAGEAVIDAIGKRISERRSMGGELKVLVILDGTTPIASNDLESKVRRRLEKIGAEVRILHPLREGLQPFYMTRLHDKVMIADGRAAILGGRNLSDHYFNGHGDDVWYDADVRIEGPAVEDLQMHWLKMWCVLDRLSRIDRFFAPPEKILAGIRHFWKHGRFPDGASPLEVFADRSWFPVPERRGDLDAAVLYDNPMVWKLGPTVAVLKELIEGSRQDIDMVTPFPNFTPDICDALIDAVDRGVHVRIVVNSERRALRKGPYWKALLPAILRLGRAGVEFWGWEGARDDEAGMIEQCSPRRWPFSGIHAKYVQVDGEVSIVSASNFNVRSAYYNTEAGILVEDEKFAGQIRRRVDTLTGSVPFLMECSKGTSLVIPRPAERFNRESLDEIAKELGNDQEKIEAYGPMF